jgi:hypothetical protein
VVIRATAGLITNTSLAKNTLSPTAVKVVQLGHQLVLDSLGQRLNAYSKYELNRWGAGFI